MVIAVVVYLLFGEAELHFRVEVKGASSVFLSQMGQSLQVDSLVEDFTCHSLDVLLTEPSPYPNLNEDRDTLSKRCLGPV